MRLTFILLLALICIGAASVAQQATDLKFDQKFTRCEKKWVVFPTKPGENKYPYGYIYVDMSAGYTLELKGFFKIDSLNKYIVDTSATKTSLIKYRLGPTTANVALLPESRFAEMHIQPEWFYSMFIKIYYSPYTDTVAYNFRMGFNLNAAGDSEAALPYLDKVYKADPNYKGLAFEMAYAYNVLKKGNEAIAILEPAIKSNPKELMLYREMGFAYALKSDAASAAKWLEQGIEQCTEQQTATKGELAFNIAITYKTVVIRMSLKIG